MQRRWKYSCIMAILATLSVTPHLQAAEMQLPDIRTQPTPQAVLNEHIDALNKCDWNRLVAQYPEDAQIHLLNGTIITGRKAIGELFAGFCKDPKDGGLNGINFKVVQSTLIGGTFATHWVASAPFLAEPYKGSDVARPASTLDLPLHAYLEKPVEVQELIKEGLTAATEDLQRFIRDSGV